MVVAYQGNLPSFDYFGDVVRRSILTEAGVHEAAHAILDHCNGEDVPGTIRVWIVDEQAAGLTPCKPPTGEKLRGWLIAAVGGQVGQAIWLSKYRDMSFDEGMNDCESNACGDLMAFRKFGKDQPMTLTEARFEARKLLLPRWRLVEQYAMSIASRGKLSGSAIRS